MLVAQLTDAAQEAVRDGDEARLALHGLDDDGGHRGRVHLRDEGVLELADAPVDVLLLAHPVRGPVEVGDGQPVDLGGEGAEALLEEAVLAGEREREERAAVVGALERDDRRPAGVAAGELDRVLHALRPAVGEERLLGEGARGDLVQDLAQPDVRLVGGDERAHVDELLRLRGERGHDAARAVAHRERPLRALDDHLGRLAQAPRHRAGPAGENLTALGARDLGLESDRSHVQPPRRSARDRHSLGTSREASRTMRTA